jgi:hypothetical protein
LASFYIILQALDDLFDRVVRGSVTNESRDLGSRKRCDAADNIESSKSVEKKLKPFTGANIRACISKYGGRTNKIWNSPEKE